jgi:hypothetical protein
VTRILAAQHAAGHHCLSCASRSFSLRTIYVISLHLLACAGCMLAVLAAEQNSGFATSTSQSVMLIDRKVKRRAQGEKRHIVPFDNAPTHHRMPPHRSARTVTSHFSARQHHQSRPASRPGIIVAFKACRHLVERTSQLIATTTSPSPKSSPTCSRPAGALIKALTPETIRNCCLGHILHISASPHAWRHIARHGCWKAGAAAAGARLRRHDEQVRPGRCGGVNDLNSWPASSALKALRRRLHHHCRGLRML